jgi:hypothetical protein
MQDYLGSLPVEQVAAWYLRAAGAALQKKIDNQEPLAGRFLAFYMVNHNPDITLLFDAPSYLQNNHYVTSVLKYHRKVFLTEQKGKQAKGEKWVGVIPRIQKLPGAPNWDDLSKNHEMQYHSLVEIGSGLLDIMRIRDEGEPWEKDLFGSLRGFQLLSRVIVTGQRLSNGRVKIKFGEWHCQVQDRYDFNNKERLRLPNPDYKQTYPEAIRPQDEWMMVYHTNAERMEKAKLACPFNVRSREWQVNDSEIIREAEVDPNRRL